jgi:hypothetical protein
MTFIFSYLIFYDIITANFKDSFEDVLLTAAEHDEIIDIMEPLKYLMDCFTIIQKPGLTLLDARCLFDAIIKAPAFHIINTNQSYLHPSSKTLSAHNFEVGVCNALMGGELQRDEIKELAHLKRKRNDNIGNENNDNNDFPYVHGLNAFEDYRRGKLDKQSKKIDHKSEYIELDFIPPTSVGTESLFSVARNILHYSRSHMDINNFECILILKANRAYWDLFTVASVMK